MYKEISLAEIKVLENTRKEVNVKEQDFKDLMASIQQVGIRQPIEVVEIGDKYGLVTGQRRFLAAKELKLKTIPAMIIEAENGEITKLQIIENLHRKDISIFEQAEGLAKLIDETKSTITEISAAIGKSIRYIYDISALVNLIPQIKALYEKNEVTLRAIIVLAKMGKPSQELYFKQSKEGFDLDNFAEKDYELKSLLSAPFELTQDLGKGLPICNTCQYNTDLNKDLFGLPKKSEPACMNISCYYAKIKRVVELKIEELKAKNVKYAIVVDRWNIRDWIKETYNDVTFLNKFYTIQGKAKEEDVIHCLIVDSKNLSKIGTVVKRVEKDPRVTEKKVKKANKEGKEPVSSPEEIDAKTWRRLEINSYNAYAHYANECYEQLKKLKDSKEPVTESSKHFIAVMYLHSAYSYRDRIKELTGQSMNSEKMDSSLKISWFRVMIAIAFHEVYSPLAESFASKNGFSELLQMFEYTGLDTNKIFKDTMKEYIEKRNSILSNFEKRHERKPAKSNIPNKFYSLEKFLEYE